MDAHIEDLDTNADTAGNVLLDLCEQRDLLLVNTEDKCLGKITWEVQRCQSTIDYCVISHKLYARFENMQIHEDREFSLGNGHKHIRLSFGKFSATAMRAKQDRKIYYSKK